MELNSNRPCRLGSCQGSEEQGTPHSGGSADSAGIPELLQVLYMYMFNLENKTESSNQQAFAQKWEDRIRQAYQIAKENSQKSSAKGKKYFD